MFTDSLLSSWLDIAIRRVRKALPTPYRAPARDSDVEVLLIALLSDQLPARLHRALRSAGQVAAGSGWRQFEDFRFERCASTAEEQDQHWRWSELTCRQENACNGYHPILATCTSYRVNGEIVGIHSKGAAIYPNVGYGYSCEVFQSCQADDAWVQPLRSLPIWSA